MRVWEACSISCMSQVSDRPLQSHELVHGHTMLTELVWESMSGVERSQQGET